MIIKCKECGADISSIAKFCPKCGCPNKKTHNKLSIASFVLGIIDGLYAFGLCINTYFDGYKNFEFVFVIIILTLLSIVFGMISLSKVKNKTKSILGVTLGLVSAIVTIVVCAL